MQSKDNYKTCLPSVILLNLVILYTPYASEQDISDLEKTIKEISLADKEEVQQLKEAEEFITLILSKNYDRDLVTRFIKSFPSSKKAKSTNYKQNDLASLTGTPPSPLSKLKSPELYGTLDPAARKFWKSLQGKNFQELENPLKLGKEDIKSIFESLKIIDLSNKNIVYDELGKEYYSKSHPNTFGPRPLKDMIQSLERMKGTFTKLDLSNNNVSNEGLKSLVNTLENYDKLEELNLSRNNINDSGFKLLIPLFKLPNFKRLNVSGNFGPKEETLSFLEENIPEDRKNKIQIITK